MPSYERLFPCGISLVTRYPADEALRYVPSHGAVYLLADAHGQIIQLAGTQNLRSALSARLSERRPEGHRRRADLKAVIATVWWKPAYSQFETSYEFHLVSRQLRPDDYGELCAFGPAWFARVDPSDRLPRFVATRLIGGEGGQVVGPFPDRTTCAKLIERLEDLFDLCRYYHILEKAPHGEACAYFEMGRCGAPCDGSMSLPDYQQLVGGALEMATGKGEQTIAEWERRMAAAAVATRYEEAAAFKRRLAEARRLLPASCRFARHADEFRFLIVQRAAGRRRVQPFFATREGVSRGQVASLGSVAGVADEWLAQVRERGRPPRTVDWSLASEQASLVTHFLFKRERLPGLILHPCELGDAAQLTARVREAFGRAGAEAASRK